MPGGDPRRYHDWKIVRYHRWLERRTLTQYALLLGVYVFVVTTVVMAVIWWLVPHSWLGPYPLVYPLAALPIHGALHRPADLAAAEGSPANRDETSLLEK
jgi:hypothetical protein